VVVKCVHIAAGERIQAGDATDQWHDHWHTAAVSPTQWHFTR